MLGLVVMAWVLEPFDGGLIVVVDGGGRPVTALLRQRILLVY